MIERSIVVHSPLKPCEACQDAVDDLVAAVQDYAASGRDTTMSTYCKVCDSRITAETKLTHVIDPSVMLPHKRTELEKRTGMSGRVLEKGELPPGGPAVPGWVPIKDAPKVPRQKAKLKVTKEKKGK